MVVNLYYSGKTCSEKSAPLDDDITSFYHTHEYTIIDMCIR